MFFKVFNDRMRLAQQEIKNNMTVSTADLGKKLADQKDHDVKKSKKGEDLKISKMLHDRCGSFICLLADCTEVY